MIPLNKPLIYKEGERSIVRKETFEDIFKGLHVTYTFSARQGLDLIYKKLYIERGPTTVAVTPLTCFEALYPIIANGHRIYFVDVDNETFNMDPLLIPEEADVVQSVYLGGNPIDMEMLKTVTERNNQELIEDCAQSLLSSVNNQYTGTFGNFSVFSLPKNIYSIAGGLLITRTPFIYKPGPEMGLSATVYRKLKRSLEAEIDQYPSLKATLHRILISIKGERTKLLNTSLSLNTAATESINTQTRILFHLNEIRKMNVDYLITKLTNDRIVMQKSPGNAISNYNRLYFRSKEKDSGEIIKELREAGIGANHLTQNFRSYYQEDVFTDSLMKIFADRKKLQQYMVLHNKIFCIPISPALRKHELDHIISKLNRI